MTVRFADLARTLPCGAVAGLLAGAPRSRLKPANTVARVEWHDGFHLGVDELARQPGYRGPQFVALGLELARDGYLDARIIGDAARAGNHGPQSLKRVWHLVARFGLGVS